MRDKVTGEFDPYIDERSASQNNLGLANFRSESLDRPQFTWLEVVTFILIMVTALYCLKIWCKRRRVKRMQGVRVTLLEVRHAPVHAP